MNRRDLIRAGGLLTVSPAALRPQQRSRVSLNQGALSIDCVAGSAPLVRSLRNPQTGFEWSRTGSPIHPLFTSETLRPAWTVESSEASAKEGRIEYSGGGLLRVVQSFHAVPRHSVVEIESRFLSTGRDAIAGVTAFGPLRFPLRRDLGPLDIHCVRRNSYSIERLPVESSSPFQVNGGGWNQPEHAGLLILEAVNSGEFLIAGIEFERGWRYRIVPDPAGPWLEIDVANLRHDLSPGASLKCPRIFLGLAKGDRDSAFATAHGYLKAHVFPRPLPDSPWVVYDIWGTEASGVEEALLAEIDVAAGLGVELFYVDAAWYEGSSKTGTGDWGCGIGNYAEDRKKFPKGLAYMSGVAHARGMKFGLWVGPNIVDSRLVPGVIPQRWVARAGGKDRVLTIKEWESACHQVCLGCREYIDHLKAKLEHIVREYKLDWLKWDNSGIPGIPGQCDRSDHGHQAGDGSYAALLGQYEIFDYLHERFPDLVLEQCGYGSRLDYGLARTIRANWLSDASFPSRHVRENALIASTIYPSYYNGGWVIKEPELEKTKDPAVLDTIFRSRMIGLFGFGTLHGKLSERISLMPAPVLDAARRNIPVYKKYRHLLHQRAHRLLPALGSAERWQAVQFTAPDGSEAVVMCFRNNSTQSSLRIRVKDLEASRMYRIVSANGSPELQLPGKQLLSEGLVVTLAKPETSDVLFVQL